LGSLVDATPASKTPNLCNALPASKARPDATAAARLRRPASVAPISPAAVRRCDHVRKPVRLTGGVGLPGETAAVPSAWRR